MVWFDLNGVMQKEQAVPYSGQGGIYPHSGRVVRVRALYIMGVISLSMNILAKTSPLAVAV